MEDVQFEERRISLEDLQNMANAADLESVLWSTPDPVPPNPVGAENTWACYDAEVRRANASALGKIRQFGGGERCAELLRLLEIEEQTRCHAFQATLLGEVRPAVYIGTVRSILEKLLGKLEYFSAEPALYQSAAQCLSEYMSSLNHHSDLCAVQRSPQQLPAIEEGRDYADLSSDIYSERSEDTDTLSVHSEQTLTAEAQPAGVDAFCFGSADGRRSSGGCAPMAPMGPDTMSGVVACMSLDDIRKERRRESNKKAASKYRSKKTVTLQQVMAEAAQLRQQMASMSSQTAVLAAENKLLKQQVAFLQGMLQTGGGAAATDSTPMPAAASSADVAMPMAFVEPAASEGVPSVQAFPEGPDKGGFKFHPVSS